ncbi:hypothetical protein GW17_00039271, partial [Ensete ventricosum]
KQQDSEGLQCLRTQSSEAGLALPFRLLLLWSALRLYLEHSKVSTAVGTSELCFQVSSRL